MLTRVGVHSIFASVIFVLFLVQYLCSRHWKWPIGIMPGLESLNVWHISFVTCNACVRLVEKMLHNCRSMLIAAKCSSFSRCRPSYFGSLSFLLGMAHKTSIMFEAMTLSINVTFKKLIRIINQIHLYKHGKCTCDVPKYFSICHIWV